MLLDVVNEAPGNESLSEAERKATTLSQTGAESECVKASDGLEEQIVEPAPLGLETEPTPSPSLKERGSSADAFAFVELEHPECEETVEPEQEPDDTPEVVVDPRNHREMSTACNFAAVTDRGIRHTDNQDSVDITAVEVLVSPIDIPPIYIAVVCDGVSSCEGGASASEIASQTICTALKSAYTRNPCANAKLEMQAAIRLAHDAVCALPCQPGSVKDPPSTTVVAAVVQDNNATIAWVGDSRAYWIDEEEAGVLTRDDSWINAMLDAGYMTEEQAKTSPNQSALYRCLGGEPSDDGPDAEPKFATYFMRAGTRLILCSDGFWNYASDPAEVARLVRQTPHDDAFKTAKHLVNFAIVGGGHDNITVAVLSL